MSVYLARFSLVSPMIREGMEMECSTTSAHPTTAAPTESGASRQYAGGGSSHCSGSSWNGPAEMGQLTIAPPRTQATEHVTSSIR